MRVCVGPSARVWVVALAAAMAVGCNGEVFGPDGAPGGGGAGGGSNPLNPLPNDPTRPAPAICETFVGAPVHTYAAKVKNLLTGQGLTDAELNSISADPATLRNQIDTWLELPEANAKLQTFFRTAFQQEGWDQSTLAIQLGENNNLQTGNVADVNQNTRDVLIRNFEDSFARTALDIVQNDRPFNETVTTNTFMMTTAMMLAIAFNDERLVSDEERRSYRSLQDVIPSVTWQRNGPLPAAEILDPSSPNFMQFYIDDERAVPACAGNSITQANNNAPIWAFRAMFGSFSRIGENPCRGENNRRGDSLLAQSDFEDWRMVTVRTPNGGEATTSILDLVNMRTSSELVLHTPRTGFMTTPAFFASWDTNEDNQSRVTLNQTLITAFGQSIDDSQTVLPAFDDALDGEHADPTTACYGCHRTLDPMRQFFRHDYTYAYSQQQDDEVKNTPASFAWQGIEGTGDSVADLAGMIADHPRFPIAWAQKMCFYANSGPCPESDPEFQRVVDEFVNDGLSFRTLVRELFSSPLVTSTSCIEEGTGDNASIARVRHFCSSVAGRLGVADPCGTEYIWNADRTNIGRQNETLINTIPDDGFSRGDEDPLTVSDTNLFINGAFERVCTNIASQVVGNDRQFDPREAEVVLPQLVEALMGLPSQDPRHDDALTILNEHLVAAEAEDGVNQTDAMRSTFTLACTAPSLSGVGL